jgi:hypothetical protein
MCLIPKFKKFNWLVKLITFNWPLAITIAPFGVYVNQKYSTVENLTPRTRRHEGSIHWPQQLELLIIFFYILYLLEWIIKFFIYGRKAYRNISFEREAYDNDDDPNYKHKPYASFKRIIR